jgi:hypothetical protein
MRSDESEPPRAQHVFERMMRDAVAPALRELGFKGTFREFKYAIGSYSCLLSVKKSRYSNRQQVDFNLNMWMPFMHQVSLFTLMESQEPPTRWWVVRTDQPTEAVASELIRVVRRYALPAILAGHDAIQEPDPVSGWTRRFPAAPGSDEFEDDGSGGASPAQWFVQPRGTSADPSFADLTSVFPKGRYYALRTVADRHMDDPRALPALVDRLAQDPAPGLRRSAAAILTREVRDPDVQSAMRAAATLDEDCQVRWAAYFALRLI